MSSRRLRIAWALQGTAVGRPRMVVALALRIAGFGSGGLIAVSPAVAAFIAVAAPDGPSGSPLC